MILLPYLSAARITGPDGAAFLQAQLSADIEALQTGASTFSNYCTPRGQVLGLLLVGRLKDSYLLIAAAELLPAIVQRLRIFVMRLEVNIDLVPEIQVAGLLTPADSAENYEILAPENIPLRYAAGDVEIASDEDVSRWKCQELLSAVTWLDTNTAEKYIPQMLGFERIGAVSFSKGCYPGQEIIARTRYLGKVKRKPLIVTVGDGANYSTRSAIQINFATETVEGTLIDFAAAPGQSTVLFIVTRGMEEEIPRSVEYEGQTFPVV